MNWIGLCRAKIAEHRGDFTARFQNALYLGEVEDRVLFSATGSRDIWQAVVELQLTHGI